jgi:Uma2 family endonuclease
MLDYNTLHLPSSEELPDSDDTPVDNELQDLIPALLRAILSILWIDRQDWFMACDMGIIMIWITLECQLCRMGFSVSVCRNARVNLDARAM